MKLLQAEQTKVDNPECRVPKSEHPQVHIQIREPPLRALDFEGFKISELLVRDGQTAGFTNIPIPQTGHIWGKEFPTYDWS